MHLQPNTTLQNGKLTIIKKLGSGGFGITYLAEHSLLGKVALKEFFLSTANKYCTRSNKTVIPAVNLNNLEFDKFKQDFINEAKTLYQLKDIPNVVNVYDFFMENNTVYFYMEYIDGESLQDLVNRKGKLSIETGINYIQQISIALIKVHKKNILHRDIKPDNIIINTRNNAVLIDFGIARDFVEGETKTHTGMATLGYAPPEQLVKKAKRGAYTDIFSLGGTLYFCLTGERPQTKDEIDLDGFVTPQMLNPQIPNYVNTTIIKSLKRRPIQRFQKIESFLINLKATVYTDNIEPTIIDETPNPTPVTPPKRKKVRQPNSTPEGIRQDLRIVTKDGNTGVVDEKDQIVLPYYFNKIEFPEDNRGTIIADGITFTIKPYLPKRKIFRQNEVSKKQRRRAVIWAVLTFLALIIFIDADDGVPFLLAIPVITLLIIFMNQPTKGRYFIPGFMAFIYWLTFFIVALILVIGIIFADSDDFLIAPITIAIAWLSGIYINNKIKKSTFSLGFDLLTVILIITYLVAVFDEYSLVYPELIGLAIFIGGIIFNNPFAKKHRTEYLGY